jgi:hypothetical protein
MATGVRGNDHLTRPQVSPRRIAIGIGIDNHAGLRRFQVSRKAPQCFELIKRVSESAGEAWKQPWERERKQACSRRWAAGRSRPPDRNRSGTQIPLESGSSGIRGAAIVGHGAAVLSSIPPSSAVIVRVGSSSGQDHH